MSSKQQLPPHDVESEKCVLGSCFFDQRCIDDVALLVRAEMFYFHANQRIWAAIYKLHNDSKGVDVVTVAKYLESTGELNDVGGATYLADVMATVPHAAHAEYYAEIVRDKWLRRMMHASAGDMQRHASDLTTSTDEAISQCETVMTDLIESTDKANGCQDIGEILMDVVESFESEPVEGLKSGITVLDEIMNGFRPGELIILAARPSVGKTALAINFAKAWCQSEHAVLFVSAEQSKLEICERILSLTACVSMADLRSHNVDALTLSMYQNEIHGWKMAIDDRPNPPIINIESTARLLKRKRGIEAIIVDYLQLIEPSQRSNSREQDVAGITRKLKGLAKSLGIPVVVLAQLNRSVESRTADGVNNGRPRLSDLRESGSIEQDADKVLFVWKPYRDEPDHVARDLTMVEVAKNRNGPVGMVKLLCEPKYFRFGEYVEGYAESQSAIPATWSGSDF